MTFVNISERYGSNEVVTLGDYLELNPTGDFIQTDNEIIEYFENGTSEVVAEAN